MSRAIGSQRLAIRDWPLAVSFQDWEFLVSCKVAKTQHIGYRLSAMGYQPSSIDLKIYLKFTI
jgi:hypothetical protein